MGVLLPDLLTDPDEGVLLSDLLAEDFLADDDRLAEDPVGDCSPLDVVDLAGEAERSLAASPVADGAWDLSPSSASSSSPDSEKLLVYMLISGPHTHTHLHKYKSLHVFMIGKHSCMRFCLLTG